MLSSGTTSDSLCISPKTKLNSWLRKYQNRVHHKDSNHSIFTTKNRNKDFKNNTIYCPLAQRFDYMIFLVSRMIWWIYEPEVSFEAQNNIKESQELEGSNLLSFQTYHSKVSTIGKLLLTSWAQLPTYGANDLLCL